MSPWKWLPEKPEGIWRYGVRGMKPFVAAAPYLTVLLLLGMFAAIGECLTSAKGVLFDLPEGMQADGEATRLVALVMPMRHETMVFFDDSRYMLGDETSVDAMSRHFAACVSKAKVETILVLADRRVAGGDLMKLAGIVRKSGAKRVLFAEKHAERPE